MVKAMYPRKSSNKSQSQIRLIDLLKRRRVSLEYFLNEFGISTYEGLLTRCNRMGVVPPLKSDFDSIFSSKKVNTNQAEGITVLEAPPIINEISGKNEDEPTLQSEVEESPSTTEIPSSTGQVALQTAFVGATNPSRKFKKKNGGDQPQ